MAIELNILESLLLTDSLMRRVPRAIMYFRLAGILAAIGRFAILATLTEDQIQARSIRFVYGSPLIL